MFHVTNLSREKLALRFHKPPYEATDMVAIVDCPDLYADLPNATHRLAWVRGAGTTIPSRLPEENRNRRNDRFLRSPVAARARHRRIGWLSPKSR